MTILSTSLVITLLTLVGVASLAGVVLLGAVAANRLGSPLDSIVDARVMANVATPSRPTNRPPHGRAGSWVSTTSSCSRARNPSRSARRRHS